MDLNGAVQGVKGDLQMSYMSVSLKSRRVLGNELTRFWCGIEVGKGMVAFKLS